MRHKHVHTTHVPLGCAVTCAEWDLHVRLAQLEGPTATRHGGGRAVPRGKQRRPGQQAGSCHPACRGEGAWSQPERGGHLRPALQPAGVAHRQGLMRAGQPHVRVRHGVPVQCAVKAGLKRASYGLLSGFFRSWPAPSCMLGTGRRRKVPPSSALAPVARTQGGSPVVGVLEDVEREPLLADDCRLRATTRAREHRVHTCLASGRTAFLAGRPAVQAV